MSSEMFVGCIPNLSHRHISSLRDSGQDRIAILPIYRPYQDLKPTGDYMSVAVSVIVLSQIPSGMEYSQPRQFEMHLVCFILCCFVILLAICKCNVAITCILQVILLWKSLRQQPAGCVLDGASATAR